MLSEEERRAIADGPVAVMEALEAELLTLIARELADMAAEGRLTLDEIERRRLSVSLRARELKKDYEQRYLTAVREAYLAAFMLNATNEVV